MKAVGRGRGQRRGGHHHDPKRRTETEMTIRDDSGVEWPLFPPYTRSVDNNSVRPLCVVQFAFELMFASAPMPCGLVDELAVRSRNQLTETTVLQHINAQNNAAGSNFISFQLRVIRQELTVRVGKAAADAAAELRVAALVQDVYLTALVHAAVLSHDRNDFFSCMAVAAQCHHIDDAAYWRSTTSSGNAEKENEKALPMMTAEGSCAGCPTEAAQRQCRDLSPQVEGHNAPLGFRMDLLRGLSIIATLASEDTSATEAVLQRWEFMESQKAVDATDVTEFALLAAVYYTTVRLDLLCQHLSQATDSGLRTAFPTHSAVRTFVRESSDVALGQLIVAAAFCRVLKLRGPYTDVAFQQAVRSVSSDEAAKERYKSVLEQHWLLQY